jgi:hypothetical protein
VAKSAEPVVISEVLQRHSQGQKISLREAQAVVAAAVGIRNEFLNDIFVVMQDPSSLDISAFKCMVGVAKLLSINGLISSKEMDSFMEGIGMVE